MSSAEIAWRLRNKLTSYSDRLLFRSRLSDPPIASFCDSARPLLNPAALGGHILTITDKTDVPQSWKERAVAEADAVAAHRLSYFDLENQPLGDPIRWNHEWKTDRPTPTGFTDSIDYRDHRLTGDCKIVWEPNRHHQLVTLGCAYRLTGDERYAREVVKQLESWMDQCPFGTGMNWRSPLELGIRIINWVWAIELIRPSDACSSAFLDRLAPVAWRHVWDVDRKYSRFSSANNHLIGEAAGVYIGCCYFAGFKNAASMRARALDIVAHEILAQTHTDGGTREQAFGYHLFVLQFFTLVGLTARHVGDELPESYWKRLESMYEFVAGFYEPGANPPNYGDADDGYVLNLGQRLNDQTALLKVGSVLFHRDDFRALAGGGGEPGLWLFGAAEESTPPACGDALKPQAFPETGYFNLQTGSIGQDDTICVSFDCGELGFGAIAAHGHADALSVTLRVGGSDVLVDPGTYDYFTYPEWRDYFKGTRAHNAIIVDDVDQSERQGSFIWGRRAKARCTDWQPSSSGGTVTGTHDGYHRLSDPVSHQRTVRLDGDSGSLEIVDTIESRAEHKIELCFHFAEDCDVTQCGAHRVEARLPTGIVVFEFDAACTLRLARGEENPVGGWVSRGYHRKVPTWMVVAELRCRGSQTLRTSATITHRTSERMLRETKNEAVCH